MRKSILVDVVVFVVIVFMLLVVIPVISQILKQLVILEVIIVIAGAIGLRLIVDKIRKRFREPNKGNNRNSRGY